MKKKFTVLRAIAWIFKILAILVLVGAVAAGILGLVFGFAHDGIMYERMSRVMGAWPAIYLISSGLFGALFLFGTGEVIDLLISIEENTRALRQNNPPPN